MAEYLTNTTDLTKVASAIREKGGTTKSLTYPDEFVSAIQAIQLGISPQLIVTVSAGATVTAINGSKVVSKVSDSTGICTLIMPEIGTWEVSARLDGKTSDTKSVFITDSYAISLTFFSATITVNIDSGASVTLKKGSTTIATKTSTGTAVFTVRETGEYTITATKNGQTTSGSVNIVSSTTSYTLTLHFVNSILNNNEWSIIKYVSDAGQGENYWSIGDTKAVTLNGTVGKLLLSNYTTYAFIIGFNHNASVEGANRIHFQIGKTALTGGTDICLVSGYDNDSDFQMNTSHTNLGGWSSSYMRGNILGTSLVNPSGRFIGVLPSTLRAVLKPVTKYTNNKGQNTEANAITVTTDYIFLLSEFEVFGTILCANKNEMNKQMQYDYYSSGNSKIKYNYDEPSNSIPWWLRSPNRNSSTSFAIVDGGGDAYISESGYSRGIAPGFCV